jgi:hypothetical protein
MGKLLVILFLMSCAGTQNVPATQSETVFPTPRPEGWYDAVPAWMIPGMEFIEKCVEFCHPSNATTWWTAEQQTCQCNVVEDDNESDE